MPYTARPGNYGERGSWLTVKRRSTPSPLSKHVPPVLIPMFTCPTCGITGSLSDHTIDAKGSVSPSVDCPGEIRHEDGTREPCSFHDSVILEGWKP
jgi:hypothetical protein